MAYYGAQENKEKIEVMSKKEIRAYVNTTVDYSTEGVLTIPLSSDNLDVAYGKDFTPTKVVFQHTNDSPSWSHNYYRVNKKIGTSAKPSDFISLNSSSSSYTLRFLNNPDITNWTRLLLEVFSDGTEIFVRVDGC